MGGFDVDQVIFMGLTYDEWMNISALAGMTLVFLAYWLETRGIILPGNKSTFFGKLIGFGLIGIPLVTRWYFSSSLLVAIGVCMAMAGAFIKFLRRRGL